MLHLENCTHPCMSTLACVHAHAQKDAHARVHMRAHSRMPTRKRKHLHALGPSTCPFRPRLPPTGYCVNPRLCTVPPARVSSTWLTSSSRWNGRMHSGMRAGALDFAGTCCCRLRLELVHSSCCWTAPLPGACVCKHLQFRMCYVRTELSGVVAAMRCTWYLSAGSVLVVLVPLLVLPWRVASCVSHFHTCSVLL